MQSTHSNDDAHVQRKEALSGARGKEEPRGEERKEEELWVLSAPLQRAVRRMAAEPEERVELSATALAALSEFYGEREAAEARFRALAEAAEDVFAAATADVVPEDWQLSQFWYDDATAETLARTAIANVGPTDLIVCISAPTTFAKIKALRPPNPVKLLEYDERFQVYGDDFSPYDYRAPLQLPSTLAPHSAHMILVDPPYLSDECFTKTAETVRHLAADGVKILACTGAVMAPIVKRELGLHMCAYLPGHASKLSNEFRSYANFDDPTLGRAADAPAADAPVANATAADPAVAKLH